MSMPHIALAFVLLSHLAYATPIKHLPRTDGQRVVDQLRHLATFTDDPNPAVTRILWTENDMKARAYIKQLMSEAGLVVTQDLLGNIYGTLPGSDPTNQAAIATGSHIDAIPLAGMYDGTTGVVGGIEAIRMIKEAGFIPKVPIQVVAFTSEEPTRFGLSCLGSRAMASTLTPQYLEQVMDKNETSVLDAAIHEGKCAPKGSTEASILASAVRTRKDLGAFVELHIEQGPELEAEGIQIGIVTAIAAPAQLRVSYYGEGGHAGAQLMPWRNDASLAVSELALYIEQAALATGFIDTVATAGRWEIGPNAVNSVPRVGILHIDVRDVNLGRRDGVLTSIQQEASIIADKRKLNVLVEVVSKDPPATCDDGVVAAVSGAVEALGYSSKNMVSRAYHDSLFMAQIAPTGMIFIPCEGGKSHRPDEFASKEDIARGVDVLALTLMQLAGGEYTADKSEL